MQFAQCFKQLLASEPIHFTDIGALDGLKYPWSEIQEYTKVLAFEPQSDDRVSAQEKQQYLALDHVALYDSAGIEHLYITSKSDASSLLKPNALVVGKYADAEKYEVVSTESVKTDTLDHQLEVHGLKYLDFIKLDTQGSELQILLGAKQVLSDSVLGIEVEVNWIERYQGQHFFHEIDSFLYTRGFELYDLQRRFVKRNGAVAVGEGKGQITRGTALYFRNAKSLAAMLTNKPGVEQKKIMVHILTMLSLYGYHDVVHQYTEEFQNVFTADEQVAIQQYLNSHTRPFSRNFKGRYFLYSFFKRLAQHLKPGNGYGVSGDDSVGNS